MVSVASLPNMMRVSLKAVPTPTGPGVSFSMRLMPLMRPAAWSTSEKTAKAASGGAATWVVRVTGMGGSGVDDEGMMTRDADGGKAAVRQSAIRPGRK